MKKGIIFALGFVVGAVSTYFATKQILEKEFKENLDKEVEGVKSAYREKYKKDSSKCTPTAEKSLNEAKNGQKTASPEDIMEGLNKGTYSYDYMNATKEKFDGDDETLEEDINKEDPSIISYDQFMDNDLNCVEMALIYLAKDDQFIDDNEEIIPNAYDYLPKGINGKFKDDNILYVQNIAKNRIIEVVYVNKSYNEYTGQGED